MNPWIVVSWVGACAAVVVILLGMLMFLAWASFKITGWSTGSKSKGER